MPSTVPKKDSLQLHFLSDYYFDTKSPVAFTSPLALYREGKKKQQQQQNKHYPSLTFCQVKTWLQSKDTYTLHKPVRYIFRETESLLPGLMVSGKQIWWTLALWRVLTKDTNFYSPALMYFRNLPGSYHLKTRRESR